MSSTDNKKIVVVAASMDSRSLFHDVTMGVESSITGMVTVLAVAEALSRVRRYELPTEGRNEKFLRSKNPSL
jgi:hypothetical protein